MRIRLRENHAGTFLLVARNGDDILFQSDWDFPSLASTFGWCPCPCGTTDGTVDCAHRTRSDMIAEAWDFLDAHVGDIVDDPGYFCCI